MQDSAGSSPAAVHEFRLPYKTLLGLHSYCPVHFDIFHSVLVDLSVHIAYLKSGTKSSLKVHRFVKEHFLFFFLICLDAFTLEELFRS
jgi:Protein FAM135